MTYKTILVHLDADKRCAERLRLAAALAASHDAHLTGLFALEAVRIPSYAIAEGASGPILAELGRRRESAAREAERALRDAAKRSGVQAEWRISGADALEATMLSARYADLVVVGQPDARAALAEGMYAWFASDLVLSAGRPVLLVPYAGRFDAVGKRVLVAWDAGREATRAVTDALPVLVRAEAVEVAIFADSAESTRHGEVPGADVATFLARHGARVNVTRHARAGLDAGNAILSRAADFGADLVVMGAYGHSRAQQMILGGATATLLETMTVPVLMSH